MLSIQTNVASLEARDAITVNTNFQNNTIEQLSTGYRINSSADDAAGLAVANTYSAQIAELNQGVLNANNGVAALQIVDGGANNISQILDRLDTLATESASSTFAGNRDTLNKEYQGLLAEIDRQAANVNLNTGGAYNTVLTTFVGGGNAANSQVSVDLSGANDAIDSTALGIAHTSVAGGGTELNGNGVNLDNTAVTFLTNATQNFNFHVNTGSGNQDLTFGVTGAAGGLPGTEVIAQLNKSLEPLGLTASIAADGTLAFSGSAAFSVTTTGVPANGEVTSAGVTTATNTSDYGIATAGFTGFANNADNSPDETIVFQNAGGSKTFDFNANTAPDLNTAIGNLNAALTGTGIYAVKTANGNDISFQSASSFSVVETGYTAAGATGAGSAFGAVTGAKNVSPPLSSSTPTASAIAALSLLQNAVTNLGLVQGKIGAGINKLNYAVNLAQSQITNFSAAESGIRDADVAAEAANLTKAQVLQQASLAALAQANAAPQAVLSLLKNA
jgi:flagellin